MLQNYPQTAECIGSSLAPLTLTQKLNGRKQQLEEELKRVNDALDKLTSNPEIQAVIDSIMKLGY